MFMRMKVRASAIGVLACTLTCGVTSAGAQQASETPLASLLPEMLLGEIRLPSPGGGVLSHEAHFTPLTGDDPNNPAVAIVRGFNTLFVSQLSSFPLGSSTGGFTYTFDTALGTFRRGSQSFGPAFAQRALTVGRRRLSTGFNYQRVSYDRFEGRPLDDGSLKFYLRHKDCCSVGGPPGPPLFGTVLTPDGSRETPFFEGDLIEAALSLDATTDTISIFANYGVNDRWDMGVAVPIVRVSLDASVLFTIERLSTHSNPNIHTFEAGNPAATSMVLTRSASATGLGDIVLRTKYRLLDAAGGGIAAAADFRLPTGNQEELLGTGGQTRLYLVASAAQGRWAEHINLGYTISRGRLPDLGFQGAAAVQVPEEFGYTGGIEFAASPRITLLGDVVGRTLRGAGRLSLASKTFVFQEPGTLVTPAPTASFDELERVQVI
jgi:hypothetical protein